METPKGELEKKYFHWNRMIEPLQLRGNEHIKKFADNVFFKSGFNARNLGEACKLFSHMIDDNATICLTLAGAMTPIGMSGPIIEMMDLGFVDWIISTGANMYHDLHRPFDYPVMKGDVMVDDDELNKEGIARIYDTFIKDSETLLATDKIIQRVVNKLPFDKSISTAQLHYELGKKVLREAPHPEKSILATAAKHKVPIYTSSPGDSGIGMNLIVPYLTPKRIRVDPILDVIETTAIVHSAEKNGVVIVGGGSPKNFFLQTQPTLWQILMDTDKGGHDYFIQLTTDSPQWGGLSGATPQEAKSWGKVKEAFSNNVVVYSDASITFPFLCQYARMSNKKRELKALYTHRKKFVSKLMKLTKKSKNFLKDYKMVFGSDFLEDYRGVFD